MHDLGRSKNDLALGFALSVERSSSGLLNNYLLQGFTKFDIRITLRLQILEIHDRCALLVEFDGIIAPVQRKFIPVQ
jgi:hypothetical protein